MQYNQEVALGLCNEDWAEFNKTCGLFAIT